MFLFQHRMRGESGASREIAQVLIDEFFGDVDHSLRELGIGDIGVPKRMKKLARMFYGRTACLCRCAGARRPRRARCGPCPQYPARCEGLAAGSAAGRLCPAQPSACWPARPSDDDPRSERSAFPSREQHEGSFHATGRAEVSPVSFRVNVARLPNKGMPVVIEADEKQRARLAAIGMISSPSSVIGAELLVLRHGSATASGSRAGRGGYRAGMRRHARCRSRHHTRNVEGLFLPDDSKLGRPGLRGRRRDRARCGRPGQPRIVFRRHDRCRRAGGGVFRAGDRSLSAQARRGAGVIAGDATSRRRANSSKSCVRCWDKS